MKFLRVFFLVGIFFSLLAIIAFVSVYFFMDPNQFKPYISRFVGVRTGYECSIEKNLTWLFYPRLGVRIEKAFLKNRQYPKTKIVIDNIDITFPWNSLIQFKQQGNIFVKKININNFEFTSVKFSWLYQKEALIIRPFSAELYNGSLIGEIVKQNQLQNNQWHWDLHVKSVEMQPFLYGLLGESKIAVNALVDGSLKGVTKDLSKIEPLVAAGEFQIKAGTIYGFNINLLIQNAAALIRKQPFLLSGNLSQTLFDSLTGSFIIQKGILILQNVLLSANSFAAKGEGDYNMLTKNIDFTWHVTPQRINNIQSIPIEITGNIKSPKIKIDSNWLDVFITKEKVKSITDKIKDHIQDFLKKLPN